MEKAAEGGVAVSAYRLHIIYRDGLGVPADPDKSAKFQELALKEKDPNWLYRIGSIAAAGDGMKADPCEAFFWHRKASEAGNQMSKELLPKLSARCKPGAER